MKSRSASVITKSSVPFINVNFETSGVPLLDGAVVGRCCDSTIAAGSVLQKKDGKAFKSFL